MVTVPRQGAHSIDVVGAEAEGGRKNVYFTCMVLERHISGDNRFQAWHPCQSTYPDYVFRSIKRNSTNN